MEVRYQSDEYTEIAVDLIENDPLFEDIKDSAATIVCLESDLEKISRDKIIFGECEKIPAKYKWIIPYDFTITIYAPNVERFTDEQIRILIMHELLHIGIEKDGNEEKYYIRPHNIEDFRVILDKYGMDWDK